MMSQQGHDFQWYHKSTTITFKVTQQDFAYFNKLNLRKSEFFRFIIKALITKDEEAIKALDSLLDTRVDTLAIANAERAKRAREWNHIKTSI